MTKHRPIEELIELSTHIDDHAALTSVIDELSQYSYDEHTPDTMMLLAKCLINMRHFQDAKTVLEPMDEAMIHEPLCNFRMRVSLYGLNQPGTAREYFRAGLKGVDPLRDPALRDDLLGYVEKCNLAVSDLLKHYPFKERIAHFWEGFKEREAILYRYYQEGDIETLVDALTTTFSRLMGELTIQAAPVVGHPTQCRITFMTMSNPLLGLALLYAINHVPAGLDKHWSFGVGVDMNPQMALFLKVYPYAIVENGEPLGLCQDEKTPVKAGQSLVPTNAFAVDLSGEQIRQSVVYVSPGLMPELYPQLFGECRTEVLNIDIKPAPEGMALDMTYEKAQKALERYYSPKVWDFYATYTDDNFPQYEQKAQFDSTDVRGTLTYLSTRLLALQQEYLLGTNETVMEADSFGLELCTVLFDGAWNEPEPAIRALERHLNKAFGKDWIRAGWGVGSVFGAELLIAKSSQDNWVHFAKALREDALFEYALVVPYWKDAKSKLMKMTDHWAFEHGVAKPGVVDDSFGVSDTKLN